MNERRITHLCAAVLVAAGAILGLVVALGQFAPARAAAILGQGGRPPCPAPTAPTVITVCLDGTCDYDTIQEAVTTTAGAKIIKVAAGIYTGTGINVVEGYDDVIIRGGYTTTNGFAEPPDPETYPTIVDGEGERRPIAYGGSPSQYTVTLEGLWLINGVVPFDGGAIWAMNTYLTISNCRIFSNTASSDGGGIYLDDGRADLTNNRIFSNTAECHGGGVFLNDSHDSILSGNWIYSNQAITNPGSGGCFGSGGGVAIAFTGKVNLVGNHVSSNTASYFGGGIYLSNSPTATLAGNQVTSNTARSYGGGIYANFSRFAAVRDNQVHRNTAGSRGGGIHVTNLCTGTALIGNNVTLNAATESSSWGGGLYVGGSVDVQMTGNRVTGNTAENGAGIYANGCDNTTLTSNLVANNRILTGTAHGTGIYVNGSTAHLLHTTLAGNAGGSGQGVYLANNSTAWLTNTILVSHTVGLEATAGSTGSLEGTLWGGPAWGNGTGVVGSAVTTGTVNLAEDPGFVSPSDYDLAAGSPAIDAGVPSGVASDLDGVTRTGPPDLGAYEGSFGVYLPAVLRE